MANHIYNKAKLTTVWGDILQSTRNSGRSSSGASVRSARDAGVVKDVPAPKEWLQLASELPNAPKATSSEQESSRYMRKHKYKILNGHATMTPENFNDELNKYPNLSAFKTLGVTHILISNISSLEANFRFLTTKEDATTAEEIENRVRTSDLRKKGVAWALAKNADILVTTFKGEPLGILTAIYVDATLASFSHEKRGGIHIPSAAIFNSNFGKVFNGGASVAEYVKAYEGNLHHPITFDFQKNELTVIAEASHPRTTHAIAEEIPRISVAHFKKRIAQAHSRSSTPDEFIKNIFNNQTSLIIYANKTEPLTMLTPPRCGMSVYTSLQKDIPPRLPE